MTNEQLTAKTETGELLRVGGRIASGNLGDVYEVITRTPDNTRWALKLSRVGVDDSYLQTEHRVLSQVRQSLPYTQQQMLPKAQWATVGDRRGLLLEFMDSDDKLLRYAQNSRRSKSLWRWEAEMWALAGRYAELIRELHLARYSSNDRKLDDFYYIPSSTSDGDGRLVVLDWNVIADLNDPNTDPMKDVDRLGAVWFNLFGGADQSRYDMDTADFADYSVVGRAFLWSILNPKLQKEVYASGNIADSLIRQLERVVGLFRASEDTLHTQLSRLMREKPLQNIAVRDMSLADLDRLLIPYWELADMIARKTNTTPPELVEITRLRDEARQKIQLKMSDRLNNTAQALDYLRLIQSEYSQRGRAYVQSWEYVIDKVRREAMNEGATTEFSALENIAKEFHEALDRYIANQDNPKVTYQKFSQVHRVIEKLLPTTQNRYAKTHAQLLEYEVYVRVVRDFVYGQIILLEGDPFTALDWFKQAHAQVSRLSPDLQAICRDVLPADLPRLIQRLQDQVGMLNQPPASIQTVLDALHDPAQALNRYDALMASGYLNATQRMVLHDVMHPLLTLADIHAQSLVNITEALKRLQSLLLTSPSAALHQWAGNVLDRVFIRFQMQAQSATSPQDDLMLSQLGVQLRQLHQLLTQLARFA